MKRTTLLFTMIFSVLSFCLTTSVYCEVLKWNMPVGIPAGSSCWDLGPKAFCDYVEKLSNGKLVITPLPPGTICPATKIPMAVKKGVAEIGYTWTGYDMARDPAAVLFAGRPGGLNEEELLHWYYAGNGLKYLQEFRDKVPGNIISFPLNIYPSSVMHSTKPIKTLKDFDGLKMRASGLWADILPELGTSAVTVPGGDIYQSLEKKLVDAIVWGDTDFNYSLGFHQIAKYIIVPGIHLPTWSWEVVINKREWNSLPDDLKYVIEQAAKLTTFESWQKTLSLDHKAMKKFEENGNVTVVLEKEVIDKVDEISKKWSETQASKDPFFDKVYKDQEVMKAEWDNANLYRLRPGGVLGK